MPAKSIGEDVLKLLHSVDERSMLASKKEHETRSGVAGGVTLSSSLSSSTSSSSSVTDPFEDFEWPSSIVRSSDSSSGTSRSKKSDKKTPKPRRGKSSSNSSGAEADADNAIKSKQSSFRSEVSEDDGGWQSQFNRVQGLYERVSLLLVHC